jgi:MFS family permease
LRDSNLWLLAVAFLVVGFNAGVPMVFGPFLIGAIEPAASRSLYVALVFAVPALMAFLGQNYWGGTFDHSGRYKPFLVGSFLVAGLTFFMLLDAESGLAFVGLLGIGTFFSVALLPIGQVYATVHHGTAKGQVLGFLFAAESVGWGLACLMGVTGWAGLDGRAFLDRLFSLSLVLSSAVGLLLAIGFSAPPLEAGGRRAPTLASLVSEWGTLYRDRRIMRMAAVVFLLTAGSVLFLAFYTTYLCVHLGGSKALLGASLAAGTFLGAVSFPLYGRLSDRIGRRPLILAATVSYVFLFGSFVFVADPRLLAFLYSIPLYPAIRVATNAFLADLTDVGVRGGGMGLIEGVQAISSAIAPLVGYAVLEAYGYAALPAAACVLMLISASLVARVMPIGCPGESVGRA